MKIAPVWNLPPANLIECLRLRSAAQVESRADVVRDEVEISERAQWMSKMQELPQARQERVAQIKAALADGSYDADRHIDAALDRLIDELPLEDLATRISRPRMV